MGSGCQFRIDSDFFRDLFCGATSMKRTAAYVIPVFGIFLWSMAPLIRGTETLYLRDVFNTHLEKKWTQAEAMRQGRLPLVDSLRDGGQPHLGKIQ